MYSMRIEDARSKTKPRGVVRDLQSKTCLDMCNNIVRVLFNKLCFKRLKKNDGLASATLSFAQAAFTVSI